MLEQRKLGYDLIFFSYVSTAVKKELLLDAVLNPVDDHFIYRVPWKMIAASNSRKHFVHSAMYITI